MLRALDRNAGSKPIRNLFTNPGLETLSGLQLVIRTNLATDPNAVTGFTVATGGAGWRNTRWFGNNTQTAGTYTLMTGQVDGPLPEITTYARKTWTGTITLTNNGDTGFDHGQGGTAATPVTPGQNYTVTSYLRPSSAGKTNAQISFYWRDSAGGVLSRVNGPQIAGPFTAGQWVRLSHTATAPAGAAYLAPASDFQGGTLWATGDTLDGTGLVFEQCDIVRPFFSGASAAYEDFTYAWTGAANNSTSQMKAPAVKGAGGAGGGRAACASTQWSASGTRSLRVTPMSAQSSNADSFGDIHGMLGGYVFKPNTLYTIAGTCRMTTAQSGASFGSVTKFRVNVGSDLVLTPVRVKSNAPGVERVVATFTTGSATNIAFIRALNGSSEISGNTDVWWDDLFLAEGDWTGTDHVDGTKPFSRWEGTANDSASVGYPSQLLDLAGKPLLDLTTPGITVLDDSFGAGEGRTFYTVVEPLANAGAGNQQIVIYGIDALNDTVANTFLTLRYQGLSDPAMLNRRTGGAGPLKGGVPLQSRIVACWGLRDDGTQFMTHSNLAPTLDGQAMAVPHQRINVFSDGSLMRHVRTIMYRGYHSAATRQAVSRYLGNKYGAYVA